MQGVKLEEVSRAAGRARACEVVGAWADYDIRLTRLASRAGRCSAVLAGTLALLRQY
jgi:hypothetical protein